MEQIFYPEYGSKKSALILSPTIFTPEAQHIFNSLRPWFWDLQLWQSCVDNGIYFNDKNIKHYIDNQQKKHPNILTYEIQLTSEKDISEKDIEDFNSKFTWRGFGDVPDPPKYRALVCRDNIVRILCSRYEFEEEFNKLGISNNKKKSKQIRLKMLQSYVTDKNTLIFNGIKYNDLWCYTVRSHDGDNDYENVVENVEPEKTSEFQYTFQLNHIDYEMNGQKFIDEILKLFSE